jgi:mevalonate kinase
MPESRSFNSKLLMFGEYSLISGSKALAFPLSNFAGRLIHQKPLEQSLWDFNGLFNYLIYSSVGELFDNERLLNDARTGLCFESNIPVGYGVGSSGALCAAVYSEYAISPVSPVNITINELKALKGIFSVMESYFHGKSSGIDPLVSYINKPLLLNSPDEIEIIEKDITETPFNINLYDSGIYAETSGLVADYLQNMENQEFRELIENDYTPLLNNIITSYLDGTDCRDNLFLLSEFQLEHFRGMIPSSVVPLWQQGIATGEYCMKLCGSGGGGFFLVFGWKGKEIQLNLNNLIPVSYQI